MHQPHNPLDTLHYILKRSHFTDEDLTLNDVRNFPQVPQLGRDGTKICTQLIQNRSPDFNHHAVIWLLPSLTISHQGVIFYSHICLPF